MTGATSSSSTESPEALARDLFKGEIVPRADAGYLPSGPDGAAAGYFVAPPRPRVSHAEMAAIDLHGEFPELEAIWRAEGRTELLPLIPRLEALQRALAPEAADEADDEPPTLIYPLY